MKKFYKLFGFWLCVITLGGILSFSGNKAFANIMLSEESSSVPDKPTIVVRFDDKMDIMKLNMALYDVLDTLHKHNGNALCPYEMLRMMFIRSFANSTSDCFAGNSNDIIEKLCAIFTDILLKDSLESTSKNAAMASCGPMRVIFLNYNEVSKVGDERISNVVKDAYSAGISELRAVYDEGYRLVAVC